MRIDPDALERLKKEQELARQTVATLANSLGAGGGRDLARAVTRHTDSLVLGVVDAAMAALPEAQRDAADRVSLVALGSYGRRDLCPYSDVDLMFLVEDPDSVESFVNAVLYALWDLKLEVGHSVRTTAETLGAAQDDQSTASGLLDARRLRGPEAPFEALVRKLRLELTGDRVPKFVEEKLAEAKRRRQRFGNTVFLLEPNVKESEGGLREMHSALWIAFARWRSHRIDDLVRIGVLSSREAAALDRAYDFILRVRAELHLAAKRRQDNLQFVHQEAIAARLGYLDPRELDHDKRTHGVERFMRAYYFNAKQNEVHSQMIIERATSHRSRRVMEARPAPGGFKIWSQMLTVSQRGQFETDPTALLRIFRVAQDEALEIYSYTKDLVAQSRHQIDRVVRRDPAVVRDFLAILEAPGADGSVVETMHDLGILRRLMPEFSRVTARWQHSLYHVYTVDAHSIVVFRILKGLQRGAEQSGTHHFARVLADLPRPAVLFLAALLHDVGKGWPRGDHSIRGGKVARVVGERFEAAGIDEWTPEETEDLVWLVEKHLLMSDISQRRDLSDSALIESFAEEAKTLERLGMLYVLTYADMRGTSPKVWSDWKGALLRELYAQAYAVIDDVAPGKMALHYEARRRRALVFLLEERERRNLGEETVRKFAAKMPRRYMLNIRPHRMLRHVEMWRDVSENKKLALHVTQLRRESTTKLSVACPDRPRLLSILTGVLAANRVQVLSAQIFTVGALDDDDTIALDILRVQDETGRLCDDAARWRQVRADLEGALAGEKDVEATLGARRPAAVSERKRPAVKTEVEVFNATSATETVIDVFCEDVLGVLHTITRALADEGLSISLAKISTQGHRVADGFYVTDAATGAKITDPLRIARIKSAVSASIAAI